MVPVFLRTAADRANAFAEFVHFRSFEFRNVAG